METNANYTIVGAFVILLTAAIVLAIIWLSAGFSLEKYDVYKIYMAESVSGLTVDSPVEFNGVEVGKVLKVKIDKKNPKLVSILLNVRRSTPVNKGTVAVLSTRGITGYVFVTLSDQGTDHTPLTLQPGEKHLIIPTQPSIFVRLDSALTNISNSFSNVDKAITSLLSADNIEAIKEILYSIRQFANTLSANTDNINGILNNTKKASAKFTPFLETGEDALRSIESQTLPAANGALMNIEETVQALGDFTKQLQQNPSMLLRGKATGTPGPGESPAR